ncbi:hypothetical protein SKA58_12562 [Sphingomonas sp. SKA58]|nr:hypothetical protein SKA58_12562 [Sphingomonas sp. SKA58]MAP45355.1 hypothetical protein [Sphingobium sp.]MBA37613.1 hypothetical protein [Sphingobium sp.]MBS47807.1 hypothetical protein [Sphingobium sp.]
MMETAMCGPHFQIVKCGESGRLEVRAMSTLVPDLVLESRPLKSEARQGQAAQACESLHFRAIWHKK